MSKITRQLSVIGAVLVLAGAFFISNTLAAKKEAAENPPEAPTEIIPEVRVMTVANAKVPTALNVQGELVAFDKINIFAEVAGVLKSTARPFKVGTYFPSGSVLLDLDDEEAKLALLSQKASLQNAITQMMPDLKIDYPESFKHWKQYLDDFDVNQTIADFPQALNDQEKFFVASRNLLTAFYNIKSAEKRLSKYKVYAPFGGVLTMVNTNPGALVQPGQSLGQLMNTNNYELKATLPLRDLKYVKTGDAVRLSSNELEGEWTGSVKRISNQIDRGTQTATVFINVGGKGLREGMYLQGSLAASSIENALSIPRNLLVNQNSVYAVVENILQLVPVEVIKIIEDKAIVQGLTDGMQILSEPVPGVFEGRNVKTLN